MEVPLGSLENSELAGWTTPRPISFSVTVVIARIRRRRFQRTTGVVCGDAAGCAAECGPRSTHAPRARETTWAPAQGSFGMKTQPPQF